MKTAPVLGFLCLILIAVCPERLAADAQIADWIGRYNMNHDGWTGTLAILDSKADCATSAWCQLVVQYTDAQGKRFSGDIVAVDQSQQHMTFYINFANNRQKFDGYLFSWDKAKMAGTTYWGNRTFGFFAVKQ